MKNILKQLEVLGTRFKSNQFFRATLVLTVKYTVLVSILLVLVSTLIYVIFLFQSGITIGDGPLVGLFNEHSQLHDTSEVLFSTLLLVNTFILFIVIVASYFLARNTITPIERMYWIQERFVSDVAHELRTPLSVIHIGAQTIMKKERTKEEYQKYISDVSEESEALLTLTNDLLQTERYMNTLESTIKNTIDLTALVTKQMQHISIFAKEQRVVLTSDIQQDIYIRGSEADIKRMIFNIIKNAIEHTDTKGHIDITLSQKQSRAIITVTDTGDGIDKKDLPYIFNRFYKTDTSRTKNNHSGSGLGLFLVKEIVEHHAGTIQISSKLGEGTNVRIQIPCV